MVRPAKVMSTPKVSDRPSAKATRQSNKVDNTARLRALLDEAGRLIECSEIGSHGLNKKFLVLRREFDQHVRDGLTSPIKGWDDFKARLEQIEQEYRREHFTPELKTATKNLYEFLCANEDRETTAEYWKGHTLVYELNDMLHLDKSESINKRAKKVGQRIRYDLREIDEEWDTRGEVGLEERRLLQEKVLYCACRANELKRAGDIDKAKELFEWLLKFTSTKLQKPVVLPCLGIQANLTYQLGSVYRKLELHDEAEDMYSRTLEYLRLRAADRGEGDPGERAVSVRQQAMAVGIGLGWVNLTRGFLKRAENALLTARSLLANSQDPLIPAYIELLYGTIRRCRAGSDKGKLEGAITSLRIAREKFEEHGHERFVPRACWELALALNLARRFDDVAEPLKVVADYADRIEHPKWQTNVRILQSRVLLNQDDFEGGLREAEEAVRQATLCKSVLPLVDAYITRGEAKLRLNERSTRWPGNYSEARADFEEAQRLMLGLKFAGPSSGGPSNPKIVAVCKLRIAQCYAREGNEIQAKEHFAEWKILRASVEHEWVRELAAQVEKEIGKLSTNFTISAKDHREWRYAENVARLRSWLLTQALRHTKMNYSKAAELIGVKRATLYQWQDDPRGQSKRARISGED
jgi:tetratricopeptide (TPR) repeat protein